MRTYLWALVLTLVVEVPIAAAALYQLGRYPLRRSLSIAAIANLASHPLAFLVAVPLLGPLVGTTTAVVSAEVGVVLAEAELIAHATGWDRWATVRLSAVANVASVAVGAWVLG